MAINSSIALGIQPPKFESPMNVLAQAMQLRQLQNQGDMADLQMQQTQQGLDETNKLNRLYAEAMGADGKIDRQRLFQGAATQGLGSKIPSLQKQFAEADKESAALDKTRIEATAKRLDMAGQAFGFVRQNPTLENAHAALDYLQQNGVYSAEQVAQMKAQAAQNPNNIAQLAEMAFRSAMNAKDQLPKIETRNLGGTTQTLAIDPVTLQQRIVSSAVNTQSPDNAATQATTRRGQDMVDRRAKETQNAPLKPLPPGALKMQQDALDAIGVSSSINADLGAIEKQIADGKLKFGPISNLANQGLNAAGLSTQESRNFSSFKSSLERLRNESLRLNAGVQTDGDAQRAWNELFQNITDTELVAQRLAEIKRINDRAVELQRLRVDSIRGNYGYPSIDTSGYSNQPAALNNGQGNQAPVSPPRTSAPSGRNPAQSSLDAQAREWARANPNDPRAKAIMQRLGGQ